MDLKFSLFIIGMFGLLIGWTWATSDSGMCGFGIVQAAISTTAKEGQTTCFEFWLNRYQGLIASIVALMAAIIAVRPAISQLREMRKQTFHKEYETAKAQLIEVAQIKENFMQLAAATELANRAASALIYPHPSYGVDTAKIKMLQFSAEKLTVHAHKIDLMLIPVKYEADAFSKRQDLVLTFQTFHFIFGQISGRISKFAGVPYSGHDIEVAIEKSRQDIKNLDDAQEKIEALGQDYFNMLHEHEGQIQIQLMRLKSLAFG